MKRLTIVSALFVLFFTSVYTQDNFELVSHIWGNYFASHFKVDNSNNLLIAVSFEEAIHIGENVIIPEDSSESVLISMNPAQEIQWMKRFTGIGDVSIFDLEIDMANSIYIQGSFSPMLSVDDYFFENDGRAESFICKIDSLGDIQWIKRGFNPNDSLFVQAIEVLDTNSYYISGYNQVSGNAPFDYNDKSNIYNSFIAKYKGVDQKIWMYEFDFQKEWIFNQGGISDFKLDDEGNCYWGGNYVDAIQVGDSLFSEEGNNIFYGKLDANGNLDWVNKVSSSGTSASSIFNIYLANEGHLYVHGEAEGTLYFPDTLVIGSYSAYIASFSTDGEYLWSKSMPLRIKSTLTLKNNYTLVSYYFKEEQYINGFDVLDSSGNLIYSDINPGLEITGFAEDKNGDVYLFCNLLDVIEIQNKNITPKEGNNSLILKKSAKSVISGIYTEANSKQTNIVFPNPASDFIYLNIENKSAIGFITLYNISGKMVKREPLNGSNIVRLDDLPAGIYIYSIKLNTEIYRGKVVKE